ncbi:Gamma-tubulin complex component 5 [Bulinus truncatus]|nr:Gamma-tubulin complex component 5 [Bulinus truncatus]
MNKFKESIEHDTVELIKRITGFEETDVNFQQCKSYVDSNFKYHRYLDPDSHKIQRAIDGLCEKFAVHSEEQKAADFRKLTSSFLEHPGLGKNETGKSDLHYAVLSLLIGLSNSPLQTEYEPTLNKPVNKSAEDFDWKSYLLSDVNLNFISYASDSSDEEEYDVESHVNSDSEEQYSSKSAGDGPAAEQVRDIKALPDGQPLRERPLSFDVEHSGDAGVLYSQIKNAVVVQYWKGKAVRAEVAGDHKCCQLSKKWHDYKNIQGLFTSNCLVTEQQVIRETLWMLNGDVNLFILPFNGQKFVLNPNVYLTHLTSECLESFMKPLISSAGQVHALRSFILNVYSQICSGLNSGVPSIMPLTYQAFASWVFEFLNEYNQELVTIEMNVMKQESCISLLKLADDLKPWLDKVQVVYGVYIEGVCSQSSLVGSESNCNKSSFLLDIIYQLLVESSLVSSVDKSKKTHFVLEMLVATSWPLFDIISQWINYGQLCDPGQEFVVRRNKQVTSLDETFWDKAFVSNQASPSRAELSSTTASSQLSSDSVEHIISSGPNLLKPVLAETILIGKSMEMMENLGCLTEVHEIGNDISQLPTSLLDLFINNLKLNLHIPPTNTPMQNETECQTKNQRQGEKHLLQMIELHDPLLDIYFDSLFCESKSRGRKHENKKHFENAEFPFTPISKLLESCLCPIIQARYKTVCSRLVHIFKVDYNLMDCIHAMQRYFLMSSGEIMYDFYTAVFQKLQDREEWRNSEILDMFLHDAVEYRYPDDVLRLSVVVVNSPSMDMSPISLTNCINLKYNVPWPVNVIISENCQELYNHIFHFLMQMKRVKYSLEHLRFEDLSQQVPINGFNPDEELEKVSREVKVKKCHMFRFSLLYFINCLHDYIMTMILHSTGLEFESQLELATDLEQIMTIHWDYVQAIHERCLLHPKLSVLRETIMKVLNLSLTFCQMWRQGVDFFRYEVLTDMEVEQSRCVHFLSSFLNNVIKRGSFPHLTSLAFALSSSVQDERKM